MASVLVTGGNRGLGFELVRQYADEGWRVMACCRNPDASRELVRVAAQAESLVTVHALDVTDFDAVDALARDLEGEAIDVLINCAGLIGRRNFDRGVMTDQAFGNSDFDEWSDVYRTNVMGPMKMSEAFVDHVAASDQKKIVTLTSEVASMSQNNFGGLYAYRASKAAVNAIMRSMSLDLAARGIIAFPLHPGWARTEMGGQAATVDPAASAQGMRAVIAAADMSKSGRYLVYDGSEMEW